MYNIGTVTTTANGTKVTGTNTKWKDNNSRVSAEQLILILNGTTAYINSIQSIQSDTELTLSFPAPVAVKNGAYNILTTMVNSVSDAANKIVAMNVANVQFSDIVNRLATETGVIEVALPDGTKKSMKTFAEMDKQLDGKLDKAGGDLSGALTAKGSVTSNGNVVTSTNDNGNTVQLSAMESIGPKIRSKVKDSAWREHYLPANSGTLAQIGDFGLGADYGAKIPENDYNNIAVSGFYQGTGASGLNAPSGTLSYGATLAAFRYPTEGFTITAHRNDIAVRVKTVETGWGRYFRPYTDRNTTKDANGNLKAASPIIRVFADHVDPNEEAEGVTLEKLGVGLYKLKGVLGMHSDASWGGIHGGLVVPNGINNLPLVWVDFKVLADGDIVIKTTYRKHDLPPSVLLNRLITYPEFMDEKGDEIESEAPCDIPNGHWVDVRVNMPSNSIYNQKQAEAERLAKVEAERLAQEEAKRAAEEAERAEQEAAEQVEQQ